VKNKTLRKYLGVLCYLCTCLLVYALNQPALLRSLHLFDCKFALHGCCAIRMRLQIHQCHRSAGAGVFCADAFVMLCYTPFRVCRPACIKSSISTLKNITVATHFPRGFLTNKPPSSLSDKEGTSGISFRVDFTQSADMRSSSQR